jgi:peptide/nickel transport system substrate-binding protein
MRDTRIGRRPFALGAAASSLALGLEGVLNARPAQAQARTELRVAYSTLGFGRHPHQVSTNVDVDIARLVFDGLLGFDADGNIEHVLATRHEQLSDTHFRFHLRQGVRFHGGQPFGADDVLASVAQLQRPDVSWSYFFTGWFDRAVKVDDHTVDFITNRPHRLILPTIAHTLRIVPRTVTDPRAFEQAINGTGRYRLAEWVPNNRVVLERNDAWWGAERAWAQRITMRHMPEAATRLAALEAGDVDFAAFVSTDDVPRLRQRGFGIMSGAAPRNLWIGFNFLADAPTRDIRVRRALNHAVDREAINQAVYGGLGAVAVGPISQPTRMSFPVQPPYPYDPALARRMLAEAGHPRGFEVVFATPNGRYPKDREIAEIVAAQLAEVGVRTRLVPLEWATFTTHMRAERQTTGRRYAIYLLGWSNPVRDPDLNLLAFDGDNAAWNLGSYRNEELQPVLAEGRVTLDEARATAIYRSAQEIVWRDPPGIWLFDHPNVNAFNARLTGLRWRGDEMIEWERASRTG